jgi:acyl carrier protein
MKDKLLHILSDIIGVEPEDINMEDSLKEDLHMNAVDLAELAEKLNTEGYGSVDLSEIDTVEELIAELNIEEEI